MVRGNPRRGASALGAIMATVLAPVLAHAQAYCDGGMPGDFGAIQDFFPSSGSVGVPTDSLVRLRFIGITPSPPTVVVRPLSGAGTPIDGNIDVVGTEVHWHATGLLPSTTNLQVTFADPTSLTGADTFSFTTGSQPSTVTQLQFAGADHISVSRDGTADLCGDPGAVTVTLTWNRPISSAWPQGDLEYVIYETRGAGVSGPIERARERGRATTATCPNNEDYCFSVRLPSEQATDPVCFNVQAVDPAGLRDGNTMEQCADPAVGNYFNGCSAAPTTPVAGNARPLSRRPWLPYTVFGVLAVVVVTVVRRRRRLLLRRGA